MSLFRLGGWATDGRLGGRFARGYLPDLIERALVLGFFIYFVHRMLARFVQLVLIQYANPELVLAAAAINAQAILLVVSETLGVALILSRRPSRLVSTRPLDWALSLGAVILPLLVAPATGGTPSPSDVATALMLVGLIVQIGAKLSLWRSFGVVPANHGVKTGGLYRIVRHPMYAGYAITHIGFILGFPLLHNAVLYLATFALQLARLLREEAILRQDPAYRSYAERVRFRLVPGLF